MTAPWLLWALCGVALLARDGRASCCSRSAAARQRHARTSDRVRPRARPRAAHVPDRRPRRSPRDGPTTRSAGCSARSACRSRSRARASRTRPTRSAPAGPAAGRRDRGVAQRLAVPAVAVRLPGAAVPALPGRPPAGAALAPRRLAHRRGDGRRRRGTCACGRATMPDAAVKGTVNPLGIDGADAVIDWLEAVAGRAPRCCRSRSPPRRCDPLPPLAGRRAPAAQVVRLRRAAVRARVRGFLALAGDARVPRCSS